MTFVSTAFLLRAYTTRAALLSCRQLVCGRNDTERSHNWEELSKGENPRARGGVFSPRRKSLNDGAAFHTTLV
eukprot:4745473-Amphidinium_carterae.1